MSPPQRRQPGLAANSLAVLHTLWAVLVAMKDNKLTALIPVVLVLFLLSVVLYVINLASPIAPFVYSLF